jgi:predicted  nucleic acid-binding Zn-ribbon protein
MSLTDIGVVVGMVVAILGAFVAIYRERVARKKSQEDYRVAAEKAQNDYSIAEQASRREDIATMRSVYAETIEQLRGRIEGLEQEVIALKGRLAENEKQSKELETRFKEQAREFDIERRAIQEKLRQVICERDEALLKMKAMTRRRKPTKSTTTEET